MAIISRKYPYFSTDESGMWKHYSPTTKTLVEPSEQYIKEHPDVSDPEAVDLVAELQDKVRLVEAENKALKETTAFHEECLVELAEVVYA